MRMSIQLFQNIKPTASIIIAAASTIIVIVGNQGSSWWIVVYYSMIHHLMIIDNDSWWIVIDNDSANLLSFRGTFLHFLHRIGDELGLERIHLEWFQFLLCGVVEMVRWMEWRRILIALIMVSFGGGGMCSGACTVTVLAG